MSAADYVDEATAALGGEDSDFIVKASSDFPGQVLLDCRTCGQGVYMVGMIELWELVADAREHYVREHAPKTVSN